MQPKPKVKSGKKERLNSKNGYLSVYSTEESVESVSKKRTFGMDQKAAAIDGTANRYVYPALHTM